MKLNYLKANRVFTEAAEKHWGYHLLLDISGCSDQITSEKIIRTFLKELVKAVDMVAVGDPLIKNFALGTPQAGFSAVQLIETSSITLHLVDSTKTGYLDVFSCKPFEPDAVIPVVQKYFGAKRCKRRFVYRDA
jgi:S-adenosylmethionine/arginine decarboxylase-like enzyme